MLEELLARLLGGSAPAPNRLAAVGMSPRAESAGYSYGPGGQYTGGGPVGAPPAPAQASAGYSAPSAPQIAPASPGGGILGNLFGRRNSAGNATVGYLTRQGFDEGTATMMASNPELLQDFLKQKMKPQEPVDPKAPLMSVGPDSQVYNAETGQWIAPPDKPERATTDDIREYQFAKEQGYKGTFEEWRKGNGNAKPSAIAEYEYAVSQGFKGTFQDWEASKKGGMSLQVDPETGAVTFQQGGNIKPLTESQSKDTVYSTRAKGALPIIDQHGDKLAVFGESMSAQVPLVGNYLTSPEYQQAAQAGKEFLQAILRKDTGAAITKEETDEYGSVYLPRPGDSEAVLTQKRQSRQRAIAAIEAGMTPQAILQQEKALQMTGQPSQPDPSRFANDPSTAKGDRVGRRLRYNPDTGELE